MIYLKIHKRVGTSLHIEMINIWVDGSAYYPNFLIIQVSIVKLCTIDVQMLCINSQQIFPLTPSQTM
jgi:hypothetical protein